MIRGSLREYAIVAACYQAFTLSDGALRMLVLLHLHALGQTPLALALVLLPYELVGVVTNLLSGWLGSRFGLRATLVAGLSLQIAACLLLAVDAAWLTVPYVMGTQVLSGVAKDLAKTGAKSYVRALAPAAEQARLFALVALLTGSKNAMKGAGFFVGGALLAWVGFQLTNVALAALLSLLLVLAATRLPPAAGQRARPLLSVFSQSAPVNWLAAARLFLFGARDVWFAVALPVFCSTSLGWSPALTGAFLAAWVIGYGVVQAATPRHVRPAGVRDGAVATTRWTGASVLPLLGILLGFELRIEPAFVVVAGTCLFGVLFAITSSLHSWLVVGLAGSEDVAERVGFYYAANAAGRLSGTLASGWLFGAAGGGAAGLGVCVSVAVFAVGMATLATRFLVMALRG